MSLQLNTLAILFMLKSHSLFFQQLSRQHRRSSPAEVVKALQRPFFSLWMCRDGHLVGRAMVHRRPRMLVRLQNPNGHLEEAKATCCDIPAANTTGCPARHHIYMQLLL
jgi:hypothetical protein